MFSVYVLKSLRDGKFYIGQTKILTNRISRHNEGRVPATKVRTPLALVYSKEFETRAEAVQWELYLKSLKGNAKFKELIGV